jgi:myo-inositol-1(or 4)-monophosphatase
MTERNSFLPFMVSLAHDSGRILTKYYQRIKKIERKLNAGIVTEADKLSEKLLMKSILKKFPNSSIITEESGEFLKRSDLCWVLDPLDGTTNYAHGFPWFCVSIGLLKEGKPQAGVIWNPISKELFSAEKGRGATLNGKRIKVSKTKELRDALLGTGFYYTKGVELKEEMEIFTRMNEFALGVRRPGSAALDMAYVACGRYEAFWERRLSPWDVAAGFVLVSEAGGTVSNYMGDPTTIFDREVVASNGFIHNRITKIIRKSKPVRSI